MNKNLEKIVESVEAKFEVTNIETPKENQAAMDFLCNDVHTVLTFLKSSGIPSAFNAVVCGLD